jgi:lipid-binding SYLF domain-containing protein
MAGKGFVMNGVQKEGVIDVEKSNVNAWTGIAFVYLLLASLL